MLQHSSAIATTSSALPARAGLGWGLLGVTAFSFTVPLTRFAADDGFSPLFIGAGRAVVAALLAVVALRLTKQPLPSRSQWRSLTVVSGGVVLGFPLLTSYALTTVPAVHGAVVIGLLPAATAVVVVLRGGEQVPPSFWFAAGLGACAVVAFAAVHGGELGSLHSADLLLLGAVVAAAVGYAEGGALARQLGSWQTVSWALVVASPITVALTGLSAVTTTPSGTAVQWLAFAYLSCVSMYLGFFAWYRGLAIGPMSRVSQVQLVQPVLSIVWAAVLLREPLTWPVALGGVAVILCAGLAVRARQTKGTAECAAPRTTC